MGLQLMASDRDMLDGTAGPPAALALRIVAGTARMLGAEALLDIASAHIDGCLYAGRSCASTGRSASGAASTRRPAGCWPRDSRSPVPC